MSETATATGVPAVALAAYARAQLRVRADDPGCHLGWTTLAGIGRVESHHGTLGGRTLGIDGVPSPPVVGPALDGRPGFRAIRSTPGSTRWHGDPTWEHAVGPMQFLPETWERYAADGDGDGVEDPHDLDDAALAAAAYLCDGGADLATGPGWTAAVLRYNASRDYVRDVLAEATTYASATGG